MVPLAASTDTTPATKRLNSFLNSLKSRVRETRSAFEQPSPHFHENRIGNLEEKWLGATPTNISCENQRNTFFTNAGRARNNLRNHLHCCRYDKSKLENDKHILKPNLCNHLQKAYRNTATLYQQQLTACSQEHRFECRSCDMLFFNETFHMTVVHVHVWHVVHVQEQLEAFANATSNCLS